MKRCTLLVAALFVLQIALPSAMGAIAGDHNGDGKVNAADYVGWRKIPSAFGGDPAGYDTWFQNYGTEAGPLYWDLNGTAPGVGDVGGFQDGNWDDVTANWNTVADGTGAVQAWADNSVAVFSAGTDGTDGIVAIPIASLPQTAGGLVIEEGKIEFTGNNGSIVLGTNPSRVNNGAILQMPSTGFSIITIAAGQVMTLDGGTIRSKIAGVGSGIWSGLGTIELTSLGGTLDTPNAAGGVYSIMAYTGTINLASGTTTATLTKKGASEQRLRNNNQFTTLDIQEGLLRVDGTGGTTQSLGALDGTVILHGGAVAGTQNGSALGQSASIISPATRSFMLNTTNGPDSMFVMNAGHTIAGVISGPGGILLNGWVRADTNAVIGSSTPELILSGSNTYGGNTSIAFGRLVTAGGSAIPDTSRVHISPVSLYGATVTENARIQLNASETIGSLEGGSATRGMVYIVASATTLTVGADNTTTTYDGGFAGNGNLTKIGSGTLTLTRPFSAANDPLNPLTGNPGYVGNTSVQAGTLSLSNPILSDTGDVLMTTGATLNLNFAGSDTIDQLFFDNVAQATGTWGGIGSGATNESTFFSGTGLLTVSAPGGSGAVPEPTGIVMLVLGLAVAASRRSR